MKVLRSYVEGRWHEAATGRVPLFDPCSEERIAEAGSEGISFERALDFSRERGGASLRELSIAQRGELLLAMSAALQAHRDELIGLSVSSTGTTRRDAKFDVDGGIFTLSYYGRLGTETDSGSYFLEGEGIRLGRNARFWGQHVLVPLRGAAVQINAFNFPVWGFAEKAACALLAGVPVITKPATSTAMVAERAVEIVVESGGLPEGALSLICGRTGDLLDRLGPQDVLAFTGSATTALKLRSGTNLLRSSTRINIEADSLNAAVLGPGVTSAEETWAAFLRDLEREITQKSGQKCTAVRRIFVPVDRMDEVREELSGRLADIVVGNPEDRSVRMGPLSTADQLEDAVRGVERLCEEAAITSGTGARIDGVGNPPGRGYFFGPTLLTAERPETLSAVHRHEVFGPVATLMPYDGSASAAAALVALSEGSLVTSLYSDDRAYVREFVDHGGSSSGRLYVGSSKVADQLPGSGLAMPQLLHGGPGRAGGGHELGGLRGLDLYLQRVAVTGDRALVERVCGLRD